jgi:hypothetical protein
VQFVAALKIFHYRPEQVCSGAIVIHDQDVKDVARA